MQLLTNNKISQAVATDDGVAATTDINGEIIDMSGYEGVTAIVTMGAITADAVTSIKFDQSDNSDLSSADTLASPDIDIADDDDNETFAIDLRNPTKRYVRLLVVRGTANAVVSGATYVQYGAAKAPVTHGDNVTTADAVSPSAA